MMKNFHMLYYGKENTIIIQDMAPRNVLQFNPVIKDYYSFIGEKHVYNWFVDYL